MCRTSNRRSISLHPRNKVHSASLMDRCHLKKTQSSNPQFQKYKGRVVVFTEGGSSASQMTAAKVVCVIARPPDGEGQAADAILAVNTQVKSEGASKLRRIPKSECPDFWIRIPRNRWPKSWSILEDPVLPLEPNLYGDPFAGLLWERKVRKNLIGS